MSRSVVDTGITAGANLADSHGKSLLPPVALPALGFWNLHLCRRHFGRHITAIINTANLILITSVMYVHGSSDAKSVYFLVFMFSCESGNEQKIEEWTENMVQITYVTQLAKVHNSSC